MASHSLKVASIWIHAMSVTVTIRRAPTVLVLPTVLPCQIGVESVTMTPQTIVRLIVSVSGVVVLAETAAVSVAVIIRRVPTVPELLTATV